MKKISNAKSKTNRLLAVLTICTIVLTLIIIAQFFILDNETNKILADGTIINGYNLSGMNKSEAKVVLADKFNEKARAFKLTVTDPDSDKTWNLDGKDFYVNADIKPVLDMSQETAVTLKEEETDVTLLTQFEKSGSSVNVPFNYIFVGLDEKLNNIIDSVEIEPKNSVINFHPDDNQVFDITESVNGKRVDRLSLYADINDQFLCTDDISVTLKYVEEPASVTKEYNESLTHKISTFTTNVADSTGGRKHNVKLALSKFNGFVIQPHQEISFNEIVGEQSTENGFKVATIILAGEYTDGIGGGVCQASSTLYNALLLGGAEIQEVHKHTLPVKYVPLALDAMVAEYTSDLKFSNPTEYPMYIRTFSDSKSVTAEIYSYDSGYTYKTRSETINTIDGVGDKVVPDTDGKYSNKILFKGEYYRKSYPKDGYEAKAYLQKYLDGKLIEEKQIRHEIYQPQKGIVYEGIEDLPSGATPIDTGVKIIY